MNKKSPLFKKRPLPSDEMALQITSMADIFTILLVFLLKSYATSALNVAPGAGLTLPSAQASETSFEALKVEISADSVNIEGKPAVVLKSFQFPTDDLQTNGASKNLNAVLEKERQRELLIAKANSDVKVDPKILVIADQKTPYSTIKSVLASAALNGYTDFKLAVVKDN
jgi:biopolymer transport protein ExbD